MTDFRIRRELTANRFLARQLFRVLRVLVAIAVLGVTSAQVRAQNLAGPESALSEALSAACRQDSELFAGFLTVDNAAAYRALPAPQRTAFMKRFVLLEEPGRPLLSSGENGRVVVRCEAPSVATEMRFGQPRIRENLAFIPMEIPVPGGPARAITFGLVRESGNWKLLSVGLALLDIPAMSRQWEQADLEAREDDAISAVRTLAEALDTYRRAYGKLPETLTALGPAPQNGISPEAAGLVDADLASGSKDGYTFRYTIIPASSDVPEDDQEKAATFSLVATPDSYGKTGRRSFFLDSTGVLRGDDKKGAAGDSNDPRIGPS